MGILTRFRGWLMNFLFGDEITIKKATGLVPALSTDIM